MSQDQLSLFQPTGMGKYVKSGSMVQFHDEAGPWLKYMARTFPKEFNRSLRHVGWRLQQEMQKAIDRGGPPGQQWPELSTMHVQRRMMWLRRGRVRQSGGWSRSKKLKTGLFGGGWKWRTASTYFGRLKGALRYRFEPGLRQVHVGWVNKWATMFGKAAQAGIGGAKGNLYGSGSERQPITDKMRRAFYAAGVPLSREKRYLDRKPRNLIDPVFEANRRNIPHWIEVRMAAYMRGAKGRAATALAGGGR